MYAHLTKMSKTKDGADLGVMVRKARLLFLP